MTTPCLPLEAIGRAGACCPTRTGAVPATGHSGRMACHIGDQSAFEPAQHTAACRLSDGTPAVGCHCSSRLHKLLARSGELADTSHTFAQRVRAVGRPNNTAQRRVCLCARALVFLRVAWKGSQIAHARSTAAPPPNTHADRTFGCQLRRPAQTAGAQPRARLRCADEPLVFRRTAQPRATQPLHDAITTPAASPDSTRPPQLHASFSTPVAPHLHSTRHSAQHIH